MKPIPTWQDTLGNTPSVTACGAVGQAMQAEINLLRQRIAELEDIAVNAKMLLAAEKAKSYLLTQKSATDVEGVPV